ncbi:hypothetical protein E2562_024486, partial [Oryza meyeriana var. granulata]
RGLGGADIEAAVDLDFATEDADCSPSVLPAGQPRLTHCSQIRFRPPCRPTAPHPPAVHAHAAMPLPFGLCFRVRSGDF